MDASFCAVIQLEGAVCQKEKGNANKVCGSSELRLLLLSILNVFFLFWCFEHIKPSASSSIIFERRQMSLRPLSPKPDDSNQNNDLDKCHYR